jgi:hypothetical protein
MRFDLTPEQHQRMADEVMREQTAMQGRYEAELKLAARKEVRRSLARMADHVRETTRSAAPSRYIDLLLLAGMLDIEVARLDTEIMTGQEIEL